MKDIFNLKFACTHGSVFHSDDVFATAMLLTLNPNLKVTRTNSKEAAASVANDPETIVYDIGEGEYDHHQLDKARRPESDGYAYDNNGVNYIPYCSFGLLWRDYGRLLCPTDKAWKKVDQTLVLPIDKADNGMESSQLAGAIGTFNPSWNEDNSDEARYAAFMDAVDMAKKILRKYVDRANAEAEAEALVLDSLVVDGKILVLEKYLPWQDTVVEQMPDILYVVFPSARGGYNVQTVPDAIGSFNGRKLFPKEWLGNPVREMGMTFCHPGNFLLATETLEQAINCAKAAILA